MISIHFPLQHFFKKLDIIKQKNYQIEKQKMSNKYRRKNIEDEER